MNNRIRTTLFLLLTVLSAGAQENALSAGNETGSKRAWEFGLGGTALQMTRFNVTGFTTLENGNHWINTDKRDLIGGLNLYAARELNKYFYLDLQGTLGYSNDPVMGGKEKHWLGMAGVGLQWRWGEYFHSKYIDPYFRIGAGYLYKNFDVYYAGKQLLDEDALKWELEHDYNKDGQDRRNYLPISAGAGVNMWLNDRFGIGLQTDYLVMPYKNVANVWQGTVRLMWRIGGKSKKPSVQSAQPQIVEKVVEKIVEKPVVVEKIVEKEIPGQSVIMYNLFSNILFDFDKATITRESEETLDKIAEVMKKDTSRHFLITGCTDVKGGAEYNLNLSERRAKAVMDALLQRGVPQDMLKSRGVGKNISYAAASASDEVRRGDRKIMCELINNDDYWNYLR